MKNSKDSGPSVEMKFIFSDNPSQNILRPVDEINKIVITKVGIKQVLGSFKGKV